MSISYPSLARCRRHSSCRAIRGTDAGHLLLREDGTHPSLSFLPSPPAPGTSHSITAEAKLGGAGSTLCHRALSRAGSDFCCFLSASAEHRQDSACHVTKPILLGALGGSSQRGPCQVSKFIRLLLPRARAHTYIHQQYVSARAHTHTYTSSMCQSWH